MWVRLINVKNVISTINIINGFLIGRLLIQKTNEINKIKIPILKRYIL